MAGEWKRLGSVRVSKTKSFYIKLNEDITLSKDDAIQLQDPRKKLVESVAAGRLTQEKANEILAKIPDYIKYELVLPPRN
jgi:hypothetical protein